MRDKEYPPLLKDGFKDISEADLHNEFVGPFRYEAEDHRTNLLIGFASFLQEFKKLALPAEIWIDGSYATHAPDPADVDVVFYFNPDDVDGLSPEQQTLFERLFYSRKFIRNLYKVEAFAAILDTEEVYGHWRRVFGTCYDNQTPKGIFRLQYA